jgi:hypothetical protein
MVQVISLLETRLEQRARSMLRTDWDLEKRSGNLRREIDDLEKERFWSSQASGLAIGQKAELQE